MQMTITFKKIAPMTAAEAAAFTKANPMRAAVAKANVQYVLAEMAATDEGRVWSAI